MKPHLRSADGHGDRAMRAPYFAYRGERVGLGPTAARRLARSGAVMAVVSPLLACGGNGHCTYADEEGTSQGSIALVGADGRTQSTPQTQTSRSGSFRVAASSVYVNGRFGDLAGAFHDYGVHVDDLRAGATTQLSEHGRLCVFGVGATSAQVVCSAFIAGAIRVDKLTEQCTDIGCGHAIAATLDGEAEWQGSRLHVHFALSQSVTAVESGGCSAGQDNSFPP